MIALKLLFSFCVQEESGFDRVCVSNQDRLLSFDCSHTILLVCCPADGEVGGG